MTKLICRLFVKNGEDINSPEVRRRYGTVVSIVAIIINLILFASKFTVGKFHRVFGKIFCQQLFQNGIFVGQTGKSFLLSFGKLFHFFGAGLGKTFSLAFAPAGESDRLRLRHPPPCGSAGSGRPAISQPPVPFVRSDHPGPRTFLPGPPERNSAPHPDKAKYPPSPPPPWEQP